MGPVLNFSKLIGCLFVITSIFFFSCNNNEKETTVETATDSTLPESNTDVANPIPDSMISPAVTHAEAVLSGTYTDTTVNGTVKFDADSAGKIKMVLDITIAAKAGKTVAVHIHEHGDCGDTANLAHGHWNPANAQHGKWGSSGFHIGDIGNIKLNAQGKGTLSLTTDLWSLGGNANKNLLGKAVIVHGGMDDYKTQPTGNSGTRIGCGVIK